MEDIENRVRHNSETIEEVQSEVKDVSANSAEIWERVDQTRAEVRDIEQAIIPELDGRVRQQEARIAQAASTLDDNNEAIYDAIDHVNRIEARVAQLSANQGQNPPLQGIIQLIEALDAQNREQMETIQILQDDRQKVLDDETMRTILVRGFRIPSGRGGTWAKARSLPRRPRSGFPRL